MPKKEIKELLAEAERQGWRVEKRKKHYQLYAPGGKGIVNISGTPSDKRGMQNSISRMRRYGFKWKGR